jgi:hypothetical protein
VTRVTDFPLHGRKLVTGVISMTNDKRDLLTVLNRELDFLEKGGYRHTARAPWRPQFIFQDSPSCLNFDPARAPKPCDDCILTQLAPKNSRNRNIPCRYIPLNEAGATIDSFYRSGTQKELEAAFGEWLRSAIQRLEEQKAESKNDEIPVEIHVKATVCQL